MHFLLGKWLQAKTRRATVGARFRCAMNRTRPNRIVFQLEVLEDRTVPSTLSVTSADDNGSAGTLRAVIASAQSGDTIKFAHSLAGQTMELKLGELVINKSLAIEGPGASKLTISGNNTGRVFDISGSTTNVEIDDLTIAEGRAASTTALGLLGPVALGGGILNNGAHVTLSGVTLTDNQAVATETGYVQTNLISDIPGLAQLTDPNLKNPWGTSFSDDGLFSVSDTKTNISTLYAVTAAGVTSVAPTISIPTTATGNQGPTGQVHNDTSSFLVNGTPATFIYANLNGTISAWNDSAGTTAQVMAAPPGAAYQGLDMESTPSGDFLYAANAKQGRIDVFDSSFALTNLGPNAFKDPLLPAGLVPFNVEDISGDLYVAYAPAGSPAARQSAPEGAGAVAVFDTSGNFKKQLIAGGKLASPWGITLAPSSFGTFGGDLLVGNFSYIDTEINAFDPVSGAYLGTITDGNGNPLLAGDNGLWDLTFGIGGNGGLPGTLYFATGLNNEVNGLFGAIDPALSIAAGGAVANVSGGILDVTDSTFTSNASVGTREAAGGGITNDAGSSLTVEHSTFIGNEATVVDAIFGNGGGTFGGAIANRGGSQATVLHDTFASNLAQGGNGANGGPTQNSGNGGLGVGGAITNLDASSLVAAAGSTLSIEHSAFTGNQAIGGAGGNGGAGGAGGNGSQGNGGAITNGGAGSMALVTHSTFADNQATGGAGGDGGAGKKGGSAGSGQGGAIMQFSATLTVEHSQFTDNQATGGAGGNGGTGANGGAGNGGAINSGVANATPTLVPTLTLDHLMIQGNRATGGRGGNGGGNGNGGNGGQGSGGGIRARGNLDVVHSQLVLNQATGGAGGDRGIGGLLGGNGGLGTGGGIALDLGATGTVSHTSLVENQARGGAGGVGGNGGNGQGGGIWNGPPNPLDGTPSMLSIDHSTIADNRADGGAAGSAGSAGLGQGGGIYIVPGGTVSVDLATDIADNHATTSDDDVFRILSFI
jgi:uncharacterized protein (TIGR03118 family)